MSNYEAGRLYEAVIEEVVAESRQDFEDSGIDESTLQELRRLWCEKLSQTKVCHFSWDDEESHDLSRHIDPNMLASLGTGNDTLQLHTNLEIPTMNNYGSSHSGLAANGYGMGIELPAIKQEYEDTGLIIPKIEQSDGSGSFELNINLPQEDVKERIGRLREKLLKQTDGTTDDDGLCDDDDIHNGSDDINSDLDDDLESEKSDEDAEQEGQIMLCLYDKVQRVKNKWKCTLKEGIANIGGRDYVFQRANGESEW